MAEQHCIICGSELSDTQIKKAKKVCSRSCAQKLRFSSKDERLRISNLTKQAMSSVEIRQKISEKTKQALAKPEIKAKLKENTKQAMNNVETKKRLSDAIKLKWKDNNYRTAVSTTMKSHFKDSIFKEKHSKATSSAVKLAWSTNKQQILLKSNNTKKQNQSFNSSKLEQLAKELLEQKFNKVHHQYRCIKYPFNCDMYIEDLDLFIELNFHWTHGHRPYDELNQFCQKQLAAWQEKAKTSKFYQNAIETWTIRDTKKLKILKNNKLNYKIFYTYEEFEEWLNNLT